MTPAMKNLAPLSLALALLATPAFAAPTLDRATAVQNLATFFYSADACRFPISRAKIDAYRTANTPNGDAMFNVDVFRATQKLYADQKDWPKDKLADWCKTTLEAVKAADLLL